MLSTQRENSKQPWTKVKLWNRKNDPLINHFRGQILYVDHADEGVIMFWLIRYGLTSR